MHTVGGCAKKVPDQKPYQLLVLADALGVIAHDGARVLGALHGVALFDLLLPRQQQLRDTSGSSRTCHERLDTCLYSSQFTWSQ